jgi:hypothetical protein
VFQQYHINKIKYKSRRFGALVFLKILTTQNVRLVEEAQDGVIRRDFDVTVMNFRLDNSDVY